ncbi:ATP-binding protein [Candidatus Dojkabacteria bacterium]|jgi:hypothetical protein|nr:ATP-binding protein [Candidatus Dojkabacteria bacterium]
MKFIEYEEFKKLIEAESERRDLEFKSPFEWKKRKNIDEIQGNVIKSIICLSNLYLGGILIVGIKQKEKKFEKIGLTESQYDTFKDLDQIKGQVDSFVYSSVFFEIEYTKNDEEKYFVIFRVSTYKDYPSITKDRLLIGNAHIIDKDIIYARSEKAPYSSDKVGYSEIKEIIDNSVDKNIKLLGKRGLIPTTLSDKDLFNKQKESILL